MTLMEIYFKSLEEGLTDVPFRTEKSVCSQTDKAVQAVISQQKADMMKLQEEFHFLLELGSAGDDPLARIDPVLHGLIKEKGSKFGYCMGFLDEYKEEPVDPEKTRKELQYLEEVARNQQTVCPALTRLIEEKRAELRL